MASGITHEEDGKGAGREADEVKTREKVVQIRGPQTQSAPNTNEPRKSRKSQEQTKKKK